MNILITILARAGSKGCPGKSTRLCAGKPLIRWTVDQAISWRDDRIDMPIIVATDSCDIAFAAGQTMRPNVRGMSRSPKHLTDTAPKVPAIREVVQKLEQQTGKIFNVIIDLDVTAPLRTLDDIDNALALFQLERPDCVLSCTQGVGRNPYFNLLELKGRDELNEKLVRCKPMDIHNRQEAPDVYEANSSIYVYSRDFLLREDVNSPLDGVCIPYVMPDVSYYHVDSELDFFLVEKLLERRHEL